MPDGNKDLKVKASPSKSVAECVKEANSFSTQNGADCCDHDKHQGKGGKKGK